MSEITTWRSQFTKTFQTGDRQFEHRVYMSSVHFHEDGEWKEYSYEWEKKEHCGWNRWCLHGSPLKVRIGDRPETPEHELMELALSSGDGKEHWMTLKLDVPINPVDPEIEGQRVRWYRIREDADFELTIDYYGKVSRRWIFYSFQAITEMQDTLLCDPSLHVQQNEDGSLLLCTPDRGVFHFLPPYAESSLGNRLETGVSYKVGKKDRYTTIKKVLSKKATDWIAQEFANGAAWVLVDPTIKIPPYDDTTYSETQGNRAINIKAEGAGPTPVANEPSTNKYFIIGISGNAANDPRWRLLWKPDLVNATLQQAAHTTAGVGTRIPRGAKLSVLRAYMQFFNSAQTPSGALPIGGQTDQNIDILVYRVLKDWDSGGTWNRPKNDTSLPTWNGCPNDGTNSATSTSGKVIWVADATAGDTLPAIELTSDVQGFLDGTYTNYGWVFREKDENTSTDQYYTPNSHNSTNADPTAFDYKNYRPYLAIQYAFSLSAPTSLDANPDSATSIVVNVGTTENREDYTAIYKKVDAGSYAAVSSKLNTRERVFKDTSLVTTSTYNYKARHYNELRSIGWPVAPAGQGTPHNLQTNADDTFSFKPSAVGNTTITLPSGASSTDDYYNNWQVYVYSGTGAQGQLRTVSDYVGSTRVATINSAWTVNPDTASTVMFRPYIPPADAAGDTNNYDYKVTVASVSAGAVATVNIDRKRSYDTSWTSLQTGVAVPSPSTNWTSVSDSSNLQWRIADNTGFVAGDAGTAYWTIACFGGWSEYSPEATVSATWSAPGTYAGSFVVGGSGRDMNFDDWGSAEGQQDTELGGPAEQKYIQLEGQNFAFDHVGSYVTGVKDLGLGATLEIAKFTKTDVDASMTLKSRVDTSYIETPRDSSISLVSEPATAEVRASDTAPVNASGWTSWTVTDSAETTAWSDKKYPGKFDPTWGMDANTEALYEYGNWGTVRFDGSTYSVNPNGQSCQLGFTDNLDPTPDYIWRAFVSLDISEISLEEVSDRAYLYLPGSVTQNIYVYVVDWGDTLVTGAYSQAPDWGTTDGLIFSGQSLNALDGHSSNLVLKTPAFRNALRRAIRDGKKYLRMRLQLQNEATGSISTFTPSGLRVRYKLFTPYVQLIHNQRVPSGMRKRYVQIRSTIWRGHSSSE